MGVTRKQCSSMFAGVQPALFYSRITQKCTDIHFSCLLTAAIIKKYICEHSTFPQSKSSQIHYLSSFIPVNRSHTQANYLAVIACKWCFGIMGFLLRSFVLILRPLIFIRYYTPLITVSIQSSISICGITNRTVSSM